MAGPCGLEPQTSTSADSVDREVIAISLVRAMCCAVVPVSGLAPVLDLLPKNAARARTQFFRTLTNVGEQALLLGFAAFTASSTSRRKIGRQFRLDNRYSFELQKARA
jgi:hypothetical protein